MLWDYKPKMKIKQKIPYRDSKKIAITRNYFKGVLL